MPPRLSLLIGWIFSQNFCFDFDKNAFFYAAAQLGQINTRKCDLSKRVNINCPLSTSFNFKFGSCGTLAITSMFSRK